MKEKAASHEPEGKWAIEAFDFLRLFRRIGRSFLGLLFLEIGWTAYILLLNKIIGGNPNPAAIEIPIWPRSAARLHLAFDASTLLVFGSILILIGWVVYSGFYQYLLAIIRQVEKPLIFLLIMVLIFVLGLLNIILLPVTWPLEISRMKRWKQENKTELQKIKRRTIGEPRPHKENWQTRKAGIRSQINKTIQEKLPHDKWILIGSVRPMVGKILMRIYSFGAIGFAPLVSYSYEEDLQAAKVPVQIFAWAISKTRIQLRGLEALDWIRFKFLPVHFLVSTPEKAELIRRLFQLDVLLWGSYATGDEGTIWLNIQQQLKSQESNNGRSEELSSVEVDLFPGILELDAPAVALSQDDPAEAHTLLLVVIILILQNRWNTRQESSSKNFDRLYFMHYKLPEILNKLVYDAFLSISDKRLVRDFLPPTNVVLTNIIGQWVGHQLSKYASSALTSRSIERLEAIARRCAELVSDGPEHFYRLGAYKCLTEDKAGARDAFRKAGALEAKGREVDPGMDQARFDMGLDEAEREVGIKGRVALAKSAAYAARALNNRNDWTIISLSEKLAAHKLLAYGDDTVELSLIRDMLRK